MNEEVDVVWSTEQIETNANSINNGAENTNKIKSISEYETKYPAVAWCIQKGAGWYLPAPYELVALYTAWNVDQIMFNKKLTDAQGTAIASDRYWDSYEFSESNGTQYNFAIGDMDRAPKSVKYRVRAILAF